MKKLVIACLVFFLVGCTQPSDQRISGDAAGVDGSSSQAIAVDEGVYTVAITVSSSIYELGGGATQEMVNAAVKENHFLGGALNGDGSVTFTMTKIRQQEYLNELGESINGSLAELASDYPEVISISANQGFTKFSVEVDTASFNSFTRFVGLGLVFSGATYQMFSGVERARVTIDYIDAETGEILDTSTLPAEEE